MHLSQHTIMLFDLCLLLTVLSGVYVYTFPVNLYSICRILGILLVTDRGGVRSGVPLETDGQIS
jgi:hypothetical protein